MSPGSGLTVRETRTFINLPCSFKYARPYCSLRNFLIHFTFFLILVFSLYIFPLDLGSFLEISYIWYQSLELDQEIEKMSRASGEASVTGGNGVAGGEGELSRIVRITRESSIVVNLPILTKLNYHLWSKRMQVHLEVNGLWDAVQANDDDRRRDRFALSVILGATPEVFHVQIDIADLAKKIWEKLKMMNVGVDRVKKARLQTMRCQYEQLAMGEDEAVVDFAAKLTKVANDIRSIGKSLPEGEVIQKLLKVALEKFDSVTSSMDQFMNLDELYMEEVIGSLVVLEEKLQDIVVRK